MPNFDIVVENFTLGTMADTRRSSRWDDANVLGVGYDVLKELHPQLIYCTVKGFGTTGPWAHTNRRSSMIAQATGGTPS